MTHSRLFSFIWTEFLHTNSWHRFCMQQFCMHQSLWCHREERRGRSRPWGFWHRNNNIVNNGGANLVVFIMLIPTFLRVCSHPLLLNLMSNVHRQTVKTQNPKGFPRQVWKTVRILRVSHLQGLTLTSALWCSYVFGRRVREREMLCVLWEPTPANSGISYL